MDQAPSYRPSQLHCHGILLALFPPLLFDQANPLDSMTGADIRGSHSTFSTTPISTPFKIYLMESISKQTRQKDHWKQSCIRTSDIRGHVDSLDMAFEKVALHARFAVVCVGEPGSCGRLGANCLGACGFVVLEMAR